MSLPIWPKRDWVTSAELAGISGVNVRTILREIERGNLAGEKKVGWIIARPEAERWLGGFKPYAGLRKEDPDQN